MERKKSKYIGDNILLYIENPEKKKKTTIKRKHKVLQVIKSLQNTR